MQKGKKSILSEMMEIECKYLRLISFLCLTTSLGLARIFLLRLAKFLICEVATSIN